MGRRRLRRSAAADRRRAIGVRARGRPRWRRSHDPDRAGRCSEPQRQATADLLGSRLSIGVLGAPGAGPAGRAVTLMPEQAIGVFDSGVGGLTVLDECLAQLPAEDFVYFGDTAWFPYGDKTDAELCERADLIAAWLIGRGVK